MSLFLIEELRAVTKDRRENAEDQRIVREHEEQEFLRVSNQERTDNLALRKAEDLSSSAILLHEQNQFRATLNQFERTGKAEREGFEHVLTREQALSERQEQLAQSQKGVLRPAKEPTPKTGCGSPTGDDLLLILGNGATPNAALISRFPHTVITSTRHGDVLTLSRDRAGLLTVRLEIRSKDGKVIVKMDDQGYLINRNNILALETDANSLKVLDSYDVEVLNISYMNKNTVRIRGSFFPEQVITGNCSINSRIDYVID